VNAVPRWTTYTEYLAYLAKTIDLARQASPDRWTFAAQSTPLADDDPDNKQNQNRRANVEHLHGPLYADELAWLYNEAGLAFFSEGSLMDAIAVWEQGYEINKLLDGYPDEGQYVFQSLCNFGAAHIHLGRLRVAEEYLRHARELGERLGEVDHASRVEGYLALLRHLRGDLSGADKDYKAVCRKLNDIQNLRALSTFLRHHADLLIKLERTDDAKLKIQSSQAIAEYAHYPDLAAFARLTWGHWYRSQLKFTEAIREYRAALNEARRIGISRLEAEAESELARVALDLGDAHVARQRAMRTLRIANEHLLGLRQTHAMVILGKATIRAGERGLGIQYLRHAKRLADKQEYRLRSSEAEAELYELDEPVDDK